jgi:hypothetical protein
MRELCSHCTELTMPANSRVISQHEPTTASVLLVSGRLKMIQKVPLASKAIHRRKASQRKANKMLDVCRQQQHNCRVDHGQTACSSPLDSIFEHTLAAAVSTDDSVDHRVTMCKQQLGTIAAKTEQAEHELQQNKQQLALVQQKRFKLGNSLVDNEKQLAEAYQNKKDARDMAIRPLPVLRSSLHCDDMKNWFCDRLIRTAPLSWSSTTCEGCNIKKLRG